MRVGWRVFRGIAFYCMFLTALFFAGSAAHAAAPWASFSPPSHVIDEGNGSYSTVAGTGVTLTANEGSAPYAWYHSGNVIAGQAGSTLTINPLKVSDQGTYASMNGGSMITLKVYNQVAFSPNPATNTFAAGQNATFSAAIDTNTGITNDTYDGKWQKSTDGGATWTDVPGGYTGATFSGVSAGALQTLTVPAGDVQAGDLYRVYAQSDVAGHEFFEGYSYTATLIVQAPPTISMQPAGITVTPGGNALSLTMDFTPPVGYNKNNYTIQWYRVDNPTDEQLYDAPAPFDGYKVGGTKTTKMTFTVPFAAEAWKLHGQQYYCVVTDKKYPSLTAKTNTVTVKVDVAISPTTTTNISIPVGSTTRFDFTAYGGDSATDGLTRRWRKLVGSNWQDTTELNGGTWNAQYTQITTPIIPGVAGDIVQYHCVVADSDGHSATSGTFRVTITDALVASPVTIEYNSKNITNDLTYQYIQTGTVLDFKATAQSKSPTPTWTWKLWRSNSLAGGTPQELTASATNNSDTNGNGAFRYTVPAGDTGTYYYYMTVQDGTAAAAATPVPTSTRREIRSAPPIQKPTITTNPAASGGKIAVAPGQNLQLTATRVGGTGTERVFWFEQPAMGSPINLGQALTYTKQNIGAADNKAVFYAQVERLNDTFSTNVTSNYVESNRTDQLAVSVSATISPTRQYAEVYVASPDINQSTLGYAVPIVVNGLGGSGEYTFDWKITAVRKPAYSAYTPSAVVNGGGKTFSTYTPVSADARTVVDSFNWDWNELLDAIQPGDEGILLDVTTTVTDDADPANTFTVTSRLVLVQGLTAVVIDDTETKTIWQGQTASFSVRAVAGSLSYTNFDWILSKVNDSGTHVDSILTTYQGGQFQAMQYPDATSPTYSELSVVDSSSLEPGTYTITCTVTDSANAKATSHTLTLIVMNVNSAYLGVSIAANPSGTVRPGTDITFTATPSGGVGDEDSDTYTWFYRESATAGEDAWKSIGMGKSVTLTSAPLEYNGYQVFCRLYDGILRQNANSNQLTLSIVSNDVIPPNPDSGGGGGGGGDGNGGGGGGSTYDRVERFKMFLTTQEPYFVDTTSQAKLVTIPEEARINVQWKTSDPDIATIASDGTITFHKAGVVDIIATIRDAQGTFQSVIEVTVYDHGDPNAIGIRVPESVLVDGVLVLHPGQLVSIQFVTNPEVDGVVFSAEGLPEDLQMSADGQLFGTVAQSISGFYEATIRAQIDSVRLLADGRGSGVITKTVPLTIRVVAGEEPPVTPEDEYWSGGGGGCSSGAGAAMLLFTAAFAVMRKGRA